MPPATRLLTRSEVEALLDVRACVDAVEDAFRRRAEGRVGASGVLGLHVSGGGVHVKAAALELSRPSARTTTTSKRSNRHSLPQPRWWWMTSINAAPSATCIARSRRG